MAKSTRKSRRSGGARSTGKKKSARKPTSARKKSRSPRASSKAVKAQPKLKPASVHGPSAALNSGSISPFGSIPSPSYSRPSFGSSPSTDYRPISRPSPAPAPQPNYNPARSNEQDDPFGTTTSTDLADDDEVDDVDDNDDDEDEGGMNRPLLLG